MRASLGLAAYRALFGRGSAPEFSARSARPSGELVWLHAAEPGSGRAVGDLARRMSAARPGLHALVTTGPEVSAARVNPKNDSVMVEELPAEHPDAVAAFLDYWEPDVAIWIWGGLRPNLILSASDRQIPMFLIDAGSDGFDARRDRWLPEVPRQLINQFSRILARSDEAHLRVAQMGCPLDRIEMMAPLQPTGQALSVAQSDLDEVGEAVKDRPVWLAAGVDADELPVVIEAHQEALKIAHRLLLIVEPRSEADGDAFASALQDAGLRFGRWSEGEMPAEENQVLLADLNGELGLWYRIAPVSFLGHSLFSGGAGCDPYEAAALGSAVLYGPNVRAYLQSYSRLAAAGAARIVNDADGLGRAVSQVIAPHQAAGMAMAGWEVVSRGATVADRVFDLVQSALDGTD